MDSTHEVALPGTKRCGCCNKLKPLDQFRVRGKELGTRDHQCKDCRNAAARERHADRKREEMANLRLALLERDEDGFEEPRCREPAKPGILCDHCHDNAAVIVERDRRTKLETHLCRRCDDINFVVCIDEVLLQILRFGRDDPLETVNPRPQSDPALCDSCRELPRTELPVDSPKA